MSAEIFISHGADVNAIDEEFYPTPLGYAAKHGKKKMVEFLLTHGANPNIPETPVWAKPLSWASRRGYKEIAELLKQYGANEWDRNKKKG